MKILSAGSLAIIGTDIGHAQKLLSEQQLVAIPTETVYGLAANAFDAHAVAKVFEVKQRPSFDPLIVHTSNISRAAEFVKDIPAQAMKLADAFWPGPLTLILEKKDIIPDLVTSGLSTVGVRVPRHPMTAELLQHLDFPLAAPSANPFGYVSPTKASHVNEQLGDKLPYILDGGDCSVGIESTIVSFEQRRPIVLRMGELSLEQIEDVVGEVEVRTHSNSNPAAPGMLDSHYAPMTSVNVGDIHVMLSGYRNEEVGVLSFQRKWEGVSGKRQYILSEDGDLEEAATRLFTGLRELDAQDLKVILAEFVPDKGLGKAINDRLRRAQAKVELKNF